MNRTSASIVAVSLCAAAALALGLTTANGTPRSESVDSVSNANHAVANAAPDSTRVLHKTVKVGDLVLVTGKLSTDRDFGGGYTYAVIVEDATVAAQ